MLSAPSARDIYYCHCEGVRSTLKTLAYDCGNPVQYVCGRYARSTFYLLDRHALLAMTKGKRVFLTSLTPPRRAKRDTPPPWNHPRKLCLRGARWAVGIPVWRGPGAVGIRVRWCILFHGAGLFEFICAGGVCI